MKQTIQGLQHIGLRIRDFTVSRPFYEKLGFEFIAGPLGPEPVCIMEHPSGININFVLNASSDHQGNVLMDTKEKYAGFNHVAFEVEDINLVENWLTEQKIAISEGPIKTPRGAQLLFIRDPDQNVLEFHQRSRG